MKPPSRIPSCIPALGPSGSRSGARKPICTRSRVTKKTATCHVSRLSRTRPRRRRTSRLSGFVQQTPVDKTRQLTARARSPVAFFCDPLFFFGHHVEQIRGQAAGVTQVRPAFRDGRFGVVLLA